MRPEWLAKDLLANLTSYWLFLTALTLQFKTLTYSSPKLSESHEVNYKLPGNLFLFNTT